MPSPAMLVAVCTAAALSCAATYAAMTWRARAGDSSSSDTSAASSSSKQEYTEHEEQEEQQQLLPARTAATPEPQVVPAFGRHASIAAARSRTRASAVSNLHQHAACGAGAGCVFSPINTKKRSDPMDTRPRRNYLSWDDYFMALAFLSAERSKDPNKQVGACIVSPDNIILGIGYNGFPRGCPDAALPWAKDAPSGSILDTKYPYVVHAEANALLNKNHAQVAGARIYVTLFPCNECAKLLIQAGIREVVFNEAKLEPTGPRPGTMEQAAADDDIAADQAAAAAAAAGGCGGACGSHHSRQQYQQQRQHDAPSTMRGAGAAAAAAAGRRDGGVLDASYAASQRLLTLAGVKLRQHTLRHAVCLGPAP